LTLMVWFLKYHGNDGQNHPKSTVDDLDTNKKEEASSSPTKPNQMSADLKQSGGQSGSEKSEVLPGYCSQPNNLKIF
ncbi:MAG: hypothetical protein ACM3YE_13525, partial [Bacteroidota bacterium]